MDDISRFNKNRIQSYFPISIVCAVIFFILVNTLLFVATSYLVGSYERKSMDRRAVTVSKQCTVLANEVVRNGLDNYFREDSSDFSSRSIMEVQQLANNLGGRILILDNKMNILTDTYDLYEGRYLVNPDVVHAMQGEQVPYRHVGRDYLQVMTPIRDFETGENMGVIIAIGSLDDKNSISASLRDQRETIMGIFLLISLIMGVLMWLILFRSFKNFQKPLDDIAAGHQEGGLPNRGFREYVKISEAVNRMISRSDELERSRQEFVSNVSHELKTPITSMKILADSLIMQKDAPVELYQEFMTDIGHELDRENQIINDLLTLVKMDKTDASMNITSVNINNMLEVLLKRALPLAQQRNITIRLETMREVIAEVDEVKLALACNNLIVNAVKYNNDSGLVLVSLNADHKFFYIRVKDTGCGIPAEDQDMIFERFYRVDKDRSRETGGTGLGLAITRKVLLMHKGSIRVHSREGEGSTFTIRVPLNYVPNT